MVPESLLAALSALSTLGTSSFDIGSDLLNSLKYIRGETINIEHISENLNKLYFIIYVNIMNGMFSIVKVC